MATIDKQRAILPRRLTPAGGIVLATGVSGLLWSGVALGMHLAGAF